MGNNPTHSTKPSPPTKKTSPLYKLKTSSPLPNNIHHYKEQIHPQLPLFSHLKYKGNMFFFIRSVFADIHSFVESSMSGFQESSYITFSFT